MRKIATGFLAFLFIIISASPAFAISQRVTIQQEQIPDNPLPYSTNFTDFRTSLPWPEVQNGIYLGPHLPTFIYRFNRASADVLIYLNLTLPPTTFLYGAGEYLIYIPVLNSPGEISMAIMQGSRSNFSDIILYPEWQSLLEIGALPLDAIPPTFSFALQHGMLQYDRNYGYLLHVRFFPVFTNTTVTFRIWIHFKSDTNLRVRFAQENPQGIESTDINFGAYSCIVNSYGVFTGNITGDITFSYTSKKAVPLAFAFIALSGLMRSGVYSITIQPNWYFEFSGEATTNTTYVTVNLLIQPTYTATYRIKYHYYDLLLLKYVDETHNVRVSHFIVDSSKDRVVKNKDTYVYVYSVQNVTSRVLLNAKSNESPALLILGNITVDGFTKTYNIAYALRGLSGGLYFTPDRFVGLNTTYQVSTNFLVSKALESFVYLYLEDVERNLPIVKDAIVTFHTVMGFKEKIKNFLFGSGSSNMAQAAFKDPLNFAADILNSIGKIIWGYLMKFWQWLINGLTFVWEQLQPILQAISYIVAMWTVMFIASKMGAIMQKRREVNQ